MGVESEQIRVLFGLATCEMSVDIQEVLRIRGYPRLEFEVAVRHFHFFKGILVLMEIFSILETLSCSSIL